MSFNIVLFPEPFPPTMTYNLVRERENTVKVELLTQSCPAAILNETCLRAYTSAPGYWNDTFLTYARFSNAYMKRRILKAPELNRNTTPERLPVLRERFLAIRHLVLHVLNLVQLAYC